MKRRDGSLETDRAPEPPGVDRWRGPVAALVDADTASAAEMVAGALTAYHRGPVVGTTTFGKGCAQEYLDDDAARGRPAPDDPPLRPARRDARAARGPRRRRSASPSAPLDPIDREATLPHAPPTWRGPDVRDRAVLAHAEDGTWSTPWPSHGGNVGPCKDGDVCRALRLLGGDGLTARRPAARAGRSTTEGSDGRQCVLLEADAARPRAEGASDARRAAAAQSPRATRERRRCGSVGRSREHGLDDLGDLHARPSRARRPRRRARRSRPPMPARARLRGGARAADRERAQELANVDPLADRRRCAARRRARSPSSACAMRVAQPRLAAALARRPTRGTADDVARGVDDPGDRRVLRDRGRAPPTKRRPGCAPPTAHRAAARRRGPRRSSRRRPRRGSRRRARAPDRTSCRAWGGSPASRRAAARAAGTTRGSARMRSRCDRNAAAPSFS